MPVDLVRCGVSLNLAAGVEESLGGGGVDVVHTREVKKDGLERRKVTTNVPSYGDNDLVPAPGIN